MSSERWEALNRALDLIGKPQALETLQALAEGRDPFGGSADDATIVAAVEHLERLGAVETEEDGGRLGSVRITDRGRALFYRLVEIEEGRNLGPGGTDPLVE